MKKKCTSQNNAIKITSHIECPTVVTKTPICVNPILYIIDQAIVASTENNTPLLTEILLLLNSGVVVTNSNKFCCPTCDDIYYLGTYTAFTTSLSSLLPTLKCCYNYTGPAGKKGLSTLQLLNCCDTNFIDCVSAINNNGTIITTELFEYNSMNNESSLCILNDYLTSVGYYDVNATLEGMFNVGIVVKCDGCNLFIGSANAYSNIYL